MPPLPIVPDLHGLEEIRSCLRSCTVAALMYQFLLQRCEKAFHGRIIPTIPRAAHTRDHAVLLEQCLVVIARVLTAAITMMDQPDRWSTPTQGHLQGFNCQ